MKNSELIAELSKHPGEAEVLINSVDAFDPWGRTVQAAVEAVRQTDKGLVIE